MGLFHKTRSIRTQLLINILVPSLFVLGIVFLMFYRYETNKLEEQKKADKENILQETKDFISYHDFAMLAYEHQYEEKMYSLSKRIDEKLNSLNQARNYNLYQLEKEFGMDSSREHIYLIDRNTEIFNTTFEIDRGLKFANFGKEYYKLFGDIFDKNVFKCDRFGGESRTGKLKKYSFLPSKTGEFLIELGFYSKQADAFDENMKQKIENLAKRFKGINKSKLYLTVKGVNNNKVTKPNLVKAFRKCINYHQNQWVKNDNPFTKCIEHTEFIFIPVRSSEIYAGYVLELEIDTKSEDKLFFDLIWRFITTGIIASIILLILILWRTSLLSRPIKNLDKQTKLISANNLGQEIKIKGSQELESLASSFNSMTKELKESYDTLERKVEERTEELSEKNELLEEKNIEITKSIEYAKFIQDAMLPSLEKLQAFLKEFSVLYIPKDIVAGDFYWVYESKNYWYFAVADCTGHGVPGAMVSLLCINSLNSALEKNNEPTTGVLLDETKIIIQERLTNQESTLQDGMDISLIRLAKDKASMQWSGANNPLWIMKEEVQTIAADKQPVGKADHGTHFTTHELTFDNNALYVLFSDGYPDQFGGPKNKKYKYQVFQNFIFERKDLSATQITEQLRHEFIRWKGDFEQTDDVCVMVFKV